MSDLAAAFYAFLALYAGAGAFAAFWYRREIRMHIGLISGVAKYDAPEDLPERIFEGLLATLYLVVMVTAWPRMISFLQSLR